MKTLDQLEARTPISSVPFTINQPGSYYLTGNLSFGTAAANAITITASGVTLDLNGFTLSSTHPTGSGAGVIISGTQRRIRIRNGSITGTTTYSGGVFTPGGFAIGVSGTGARDVEVSDVNVDGIAGIGISLGTTGDTVVRRCQVHATTLTGIVASNVEYCTAINAGTIGISAERVIYSTGRSVGTSSGNNGINADVVQGSEGTAVGGDGIDANDSASDSVGTSTSGRGIEASVAMNCRGSSSSGNGIFAGTATNCNGNSSSGVGLAAQNATNCFGQSSTGAAGLDANPGTASYCRGERNGGRAIDAGIAIGCTVVTGTVSSANKFLGTP